MFEPHQGNVQLDSDFDKIWDSLKAKTELLLQTEIEGKLFIAKATVAIRGQRSGERVIVFLHEKDRTNRICKSLRILLGTLL